MMDKSGGLSWRAVEVYTIGHSTRTADELIDLLRAFEVTVLADVRTIPRSRHNPQFNEDALRRTLRSRRLRYAHLAELGGLRRARKDSTNTGWRNASFRGFADYMLTEDFEAGLEALRALTTEGRVSLLCAEAVPWRCHRSLVADALTARGARVEHITTAHRSTPHRMTPFARVEGMRVTYPGEDPGGEALPTRAPFHLEATVRVLQRRPTNRVEVWEEERYLRVLSMEGGLVLVEVTNHGTIDDPDVRCAVLRGPSSGDAARGALRQTVRRILGLEVDPEALQRVVEARPRLAPTTLALRGMRPPRFAGLFEAFANVVPFQQLSLDAGAAIVARLVERFGEVVEHDGRRFYAFPEAPVIARARLDALKASGLSLRKAETLREVANAIEAGEVTEEKLSAMSSPEAVRSLMELRGIGPWSANLVLLRGLGRLDVFPPGDVGATRGLGRLMRLQPGPSLDRVVQRLGDVRGYLYFCALGSALLAKGLIHAGPPPSQRKSLAAGRG